MIKCYYLDNDLISCESDFRGDDSVLVWVDLYKADVLESEKLEKKLKVKLFTEHERKEIETSSKYIENESMVGINLNFVGVEDDGYQKSSVSFILLDKVLITQREKDYKSFIELIEKINKLKLFSGVDLFLNLLETRIDFDADLIEGITDDINTLNRKIAKEQKLERSFLLQISEVRKSSVLIRETLMEKQRIVFSILKSSFFPSLDRQRFLVMNKDIASLLQHSGFNFDRLEFMQNTFIGLVGMEQNKTIKMLTIVTLIFMPPALIASIYGMNFDVMPELKMAYGYPYSILAMLVSSVLIFLFFRWKSWL